MPNQFWNKYFDFLEKVIHFPIEVIEELEKAPSAVTKPLLEQLRAQNKALLEC